MKSEAQHKSACQTLKRGKRVPMDPFRSLVPALGPLVDGFILSSAVGPLQALLQSVTSSRGTPTERNERESMYAIAHRTNSCHLIGRVLAAGANAIEIDVRFGLGSWYVEHDFVHPLSTTLSSWLASAQEAFHIFSTRWTLLIVDIKTSRDNNLEALRSTIRNALPDLYAIYSISNLEDATAFDHVIPSLHLKDGLAVDYHNNPLEVRDFFIQRGVTRFWYGNGINAPMHHMVELFGPNVRRSLAEAAVLKRATPRFRTYAWTVPTEALVAEYLCFCDGVMVNEDLIPAAVGMIERIGQLAIPGRDSPFW
jgi:hypothetical protein